MLRRSTWWRVRLWMACCALLAMALAPSVSHALAAERGYTPLADICSADARYGANEQGWHLLADCGYCLQAGDLFTPSEPQPPMPADGHARQACPFYQTSQPCPAPAAVLARGPPTP